MIFLELFYVFFVIGAFTFGGGYAMLSLIQNKVVVQHEWITNQEFSDIVAISQMTPGPIGINSATYIGYSVVKNSGQPEFLCVIGSFLATLAVILPSFLLVLWIALMFNKFRSNTWVSSALQSIKPVIIGMFGASALIMITPSNFIDWSSWALCIGAFILLKFFKLSPIFIIIIGGFIGVLIY